MFIQEEGLSMNKRLLTFGATALTTALLLSGAALAGDDKDQDQATSEGDVVEVEMVDNRFKPDELEVTVGTTVRWVNVERRSNHDIYFPEEDIKSGRLFPEESWERTFDEAGTYEYYCQPHENRGMHGVIRVVEESDE
ncbi:cupredoxin domain-containing protein [Halomonas sp. ANAO-440]|nr:cupredoxin domain-containing protein [Halomonas sp. ANAO-440]